jgi:phosphatidate cytidylyltransferase
MKNFIIRLFTAIAIVAVQVLCTYLSPYSFAGLFLLLTALAVNEFLKILSHGEQVQVSRPLMIVGSCYLFFAFWLNSLAELSMLVLFVPYLLFLLFCYIRELFSNNSILFKTDEPLGFWPDSAVMVRSGNSSPNF